VTHQQVNKTHLQCKQIYTHTEKPVVMTGAQYYYMHNQKFHLR